MHEAPVVHPTGMRHVPVIGWLPQIGPKPRRSVDNSCSTQTVERTLRDRPGVAPLFLQEVAASLPFSSDIDPG